MQRSHAFGVGCFHFGYCGEIPFKFETSRYVDDLKRALHSLPSLSNLEVSFEETLAQSATISEAPGRLRDGELFPYVSFLSISFRLFIPLRLQDELFPDEIMSSQTTTQNFNVSIRHGYHGPIAFIECADVGDQCSPSSSVRLLREYLKREFAKLSTPVSFEFIGPSPFHANFFTEEADLSGDEVVLVEVKNRGYNDLVFQHKKRDSSREVLDFIYDELCHELDLYYDIQRRAVRMMRKGNALVQEWQALQALSETNIRAWNLKARLSLHRGARQLVSRSYTLQAELDMEEKQVSRDIAETYGNGVDVYMEAAVRRLGSGLPIFPVETILRWAQHLEEGSFKQAEIAAVMLSAIGGGVVGSLVTLIGSKGG